MRCTAKNADETPCENEATTRVLSNGYFVYVCAFHNSIMSKVVQAGRQSPLFPRKDYSQPNQVVGLGAFPKREELDGLVFKPKRGRR